MRKHNDTFSLRRISSGAWPGCRPNIACPRLKAPRLLRLTLGDLEYAITRATRPYTGAGPVFGNYRRGFFDTLVPPRVIAPNDVDPDLVNGRARLGCRVPVVVASPFTRGDPASAIINLVLYDHDRQERLSGWRNPIMQPRGGRCTSRSPTRFLKSCLAIAPAASLPLRSWPALVSDCNHLRHCR